MKHIGSLPRETGGGNRCGHLSAEVRWGGQVRVSVRAGSGGGYRWGHLSAGVAPLGSRVSRVPKATKSLVTPFKAPTKRRSSKL